MTDRLRPRSRLFSTIAGVTPSKSSTKTPGARPRRSSVITLCSGESISACFRKCVTSLMVTEGFSSIIQWPESGTIVSRSETHHRRHHCSERRLASNRQYRHGEHAPSEICSVVYGVLAEGCELGEARTDCTGHGIECRVVLALRFIEALRVEGEVVPEPV